MTDPLPLIPWKVQQIVSTSLNHILFIIQTAAEGQILLVQVIFTRMGWFECYHKHVKHADRWLRTIPLSSLYPAYHIYVRGFFPS